VGIQGDNFITSWYRNGSGKDLFCIRKALHHTKEIYQRNDIYAKKHMFDLFQLMEHRWNETDRGKPK
jgi:hypothetical protein